MVMTLYIGKNSDGKELDKTYVTSYSYPRFVAGHYQFHLRASLILIQSQTDPSQSFNTKKFQFPNKSSHLFHHIQEEVFFIILSLKTNMIKI